ncbi:nuclear transport factor 2 family protein [Micromonospora marina]|uniref:nuclear transport factor 2 family protein n=1 Tax=Micromonospora marina TaxID=307120 RepID=UPI003451FE16
MTDDSLANATAPGSSPYERYTSLDRLRASWPAGDDWPDGVVLVCALQATELILGLMSAAIGDDRVTADVDRRLDRYSRLLQAGVDEMVDTLGSARLPWNWTAPSLADGASPGLRALPALPGPARAAVSDALRRASGRLPFQLGVEPQVGLVVSPGRPTLNYAGRTAPDLVRRVGRAPAHGPEDHLFCAAHQITECWLRIAHHHVREAERRADLGDWAAAGRRIRRAAAAVGLATDAARLLDMMVLADYHPLRVRLRDGSGAQSKAAQSMPSAARHAFTILQRHLDTQGISLLDVLDRPDRHRSLHLYRMALQDLGRRCQTFLFEHYLLALTTLGADNLGSLGYAVQTLVRRAGEPLFPELDQAKHRYAVITNFTHGASAGAIVLADELARDPDRYRRTRPDVCPPGLARDRVGAYFSAITHRDADAWLALFTPDAVFRDAPNARPFHGQRHLRVFIDTMLDTFDPLIATYDDPEIDGNHVEVSWTFHARALGADLVFHGREVFELTPDGRFRQVLVNWDPATVAAQLWSAGADSAVVNGTPRPVRQALDASRAACLTSGEG